MSPHTLRKSLWFIPLMGVRARCSVEFFIYEATDQCGKGSDVITCELNTNRGGLCAYAQDAMKLWCCPAMAPYVLHSPLPSRCRDHDLRELILCPTPRSCWGRGEPCTGGSLGTPGPGQISCSALGARM